jgi:ferrous iron transport protein B
MARRSLHAADLLELRDEPGPAPDPVARPGLRRLALVGNPNVGKSVIFGALTGSYATVSNYPGTTVEVARAPARFDSNVEIIDTPGANTLLPQSEDERVTRDILLSGADGVIQVADAKNLARALSLSLQLAEAGVPFTLVLNMMDEVAERGLEIDARRLASLLGVTVTETVAVRGQGLRRLREALAAMRISHYETRYPEAVERGLRRIEPRLAGFPVSRRSLALMCLSLRPWLREHLDPTALATVEQACREAGGELHGRVAYEIHRSRVRAAERLARAVTRRVSEGELPAADGDRRWAPFGFAALLGSLLLLSGDLALVPALRDGWGRLPAWLAIAAAAVAAWRSAGMRAALGRWATRRGLGLVVLLVVLYVVCRFVGVFAAGTAVDFFEDTLFGGTVNPAVTKGIDGFVAAVAPRAGRAAGALDLGRDVLVGQYGLITVALTYASAIILPIVTAFFLAFSVLEDSGYLPRLAVMVNRLFRGMGLNGKAVLPMVLGLGSDTMATLTARIMETRKERVLVTLLLALGVPCSAQLGVILGLFGSLPLWAPAVWGAVVVGVLLAVGYLAARLLPGESSDLILEMPPIRRPELKNIVIKTIGRLEWYVREAVPIFILGTLVLFLLDRLGALERLIRGGEPVVVSLLQLPPRATEAFLVGFFRRDYGAAGIYALFNQGLMTPVQAVVALVTITLFVPCVANFFIIVKEHGVRTALAMSAFIFPFAFLMGGAVNVLLRAAGLS